MRSALGLGVYRAGLWLRCKPDENEITCASTQGLGGVYAGAVEATGRFRVRSFVLMRLPKISKEAHQGGIGGAGGLSGLFRLREDVFQEVNLVAEGLDDLVAHEPC